MAVFEAPARKLSSEDVALILIAGAFRHAKRPFSRVDARIYRMHVFEMVREGEEDPRELARRALTREGWTPRLTGAGELKVLTIEPAADALQRLHS